MHRIAHHDRAEAARALERLWLLFESFRKEVKKLDAREKLNVEPDEVSVMRWADTPNGIEQAEALRLAGWSKTLGSSKLRELERKKLVCLEVCPLDRRKHVIRAGERTREILSRMDDLYEKAFDRICPDLSNHAGDFRKSTGTRHQYC